MEIFFKRYFWTVTLAFLALVAFLAARTVNYFVEWRLAPAVVVNAPTQRRPATPVAVAAQPKLEKVAKALGLPVPKEPEVVAPGPEPVVDLNAAPVKSSLRVKLLGTLVSALPSWSIASIQDAVTQKTETYMVGDRIQGAEILEIERERVIIFNNSRREYIDNQAGDGAAPPPIATNVPVAAPPSNASSGSGIRAVSENEYEVPRAEIDKTLSNLNDIAMQARIVPAFKDGQAHGFKLFSIRPDSLYSKIGVQNGDVIRRINGYDLNSPEKALEVYSKLKEAGRIELELERNGSTLRKTYTIR